MSRQGVELDGKVTEREASRSFLGGPGARGSERVGLVTVQYAVDVVYLLLIATVAVGRIGRQNHSS